MRLNLGEVKLKKMLSSGLRLKWEGGGGGSEACVFL